MPQKQYTWFYAGLSKDDYITSDKTYLYWDNVDGSLFGYWATIAQKSRKLIEVSHPIYDIWGGLASTSDANKLLVGHDGTNGYIYKFNSSDNTPEVTVTTWNTTYNLLTWVLVNSYFYFLGYGVANPRRSGVHYAFNSALTMNYDTFTDGNFWTSYTWVNTVAKSLTMFGWVGRVWTWAAWATTFTEKFIFTWEITGIEELGTTILVYTDRNRVYIWDGVSWSVVWTKKLDYNTLKTGSWLNRVYSNTNTWAVLEWDGYSFNDIYNKRKTLRAESNSVYYDILDYSSNIDDNTQGKSIISIDGKAYFIEGGKRIAKLAKVRPWVEPGIHTVLSTNYAGTTIDKIYCINESEGNLYYSYKAWDYYGVDYIDLSSLESHTWGTLITTVFRGPPDGENTINNVQLTISNTSGNKSITIYKRIDWGSWELMRTFNNDTDTISREVIENSSDAFIDIQFKIVLSNTDQDDTPPMIHGLTLDYNVTWNKNVR